MGLRDRPISPRAPWQNGYVEPSLDLRAVNASTTCWSSERAFGRTTPVAADYFLFKGYCTNASCNLNAIEFELDLFDLLCSKMPVFR
jgi:hypothetical protein